ncbi:hypothetical protein R6Q59_033849 [Mikania micrantha]
MLDALLKSRFYSTCKSKIKLTKKRIEIVRRKRNAMHKFMRTDVADLLKTSLDSNAYDRVGQLYADQNLSWCYDFVEQSCLLVLSLLSAMNKQRECPEECREAVSTLMFAAARFADLPELRELRSLFAERYGNYLEPYVSQEFVKNLKGDPPTMQIKLQMMQEIALEYKINWNSKTLEQKLYKTPPFAQDFCQHTNGRNQESPKTHRQNDQETNIKKETEKEEKHKNPTIGNRLPYKSRAEIETKNEKIQDYGRLSPNWSSNNSSSSESATSADDSASEDIHIIPHGRKFYAFGSMASPSIKTESTKKSTDSEAKTFGQEDDNLQSGRPQDIGLRSMGPPYVKRDLGKKTAESNVNNDNLKSEEKTDDYGKPTPSSVRIRRPLKQAAGSSRKNNDVLKTSNGEKNSFRDEEEEKVDKLLLHYSRKPSHIPAPNRTGSLPSGVAVENRKGLLRAATYQPDSGLGHVHPKLPDYDDFVAQLAAFRASSSNRIMSCRNSLP